MELGRLFTEHPASVGETYWGHLLRASWFGGRMLFAGVACLIHAVLPFTFVKTGSKTITELHGAMVTGRDVVPPPMPVRMPGQRIPPPVHAQRIPN